MLEWPPMTKIYLKNCYAINSKFSFNKKCISVPMQTDDMVWMTKYAVIEIRLWWNERNEINVI